VTRRRLVIAACAFALVIMGWAMASPPAAVLRWWNPNSRPELKGLVVAAGPDRRIEGRLTGGFAWGPVPRVTRGGGGNATAARIQVAAGLLGVKASEHPSPSSRADSATGMLFLGRADEAVQVLEQSTEAVPDAAPYWSDLAAAYVARFSAGGPATDLPRALDAIERSLVLKPLPEALFNRALIVQHLNLRQLADDAWRNYLRVDSTSLWATEARSRLVLLGEEKNRAERGARTQRLRDAVIDDVLARWATSVDVNESERLLDEAREANRELRGASRDELVERIIATIDASRHVPGRLATLKRAHAEYGVGVAAFNKDDFETARRHLEIAERDAREAGSLLALPANLYLAIVRFRMNDLEGSALQLAALAREAPAETLPMIHGRALWNFGNVAAGRGDHGLATESYRESVASLADADERPNEAFVRLIGTWMFESAGDFETAWRARVDAFAMTDREGAIQAAANSAANNGWPFAASVLYDLVATLARQHKREPIIVDSMRARAHALAVAGRPEAGLSGLASVQPLIDAHPEPAWDALRAEIDLSSAECLLASSPADAVAAVTRAIGYFESAARDRRVPDALLVRARAYRAQGNLVAAEEDLNRGIEALDRLSKGLEEWHLRALIGDVKQRFGDELVTMLVNAGRTDDAFNAAERLRAQDLQRHALGEQRSITVDRLSRELPSGTGLVWFFVGTDETYVWAARRGSRRFARVPVSRQRLARLVQQQPATSRDVAGELRRLLLDPIRDELRQVDELVIVPDGPLHLLPFAALPGERARFLIEEHPLLFGANATTFVASVSAPVPPSEGMSALIAGNVTFDRTRFSSLRALPDSGLEAAAVAALYSHATVLTGNEAAPEAIRTALPRHMIFHFAGHSLFNSIAPGESSLVLSAQGAGVITANQISRLPLENVRLVMLSSCDSVAGQLTRSEGPLGLARAFLSAGVRTVVASQTPVSDRAARELSVSFHRELRRTGSVARALQHAQLTLLSSSDQTLSAPEHWASFVAIGADETPIAEEPTTQ
jgi:CHAT domain-containing protein/tetratricopeptide (TPR) repeat protein